MMERRSFTEEEKKDLVLELERLVKEENNTIRNAASRLGITESHYRRWRKRQKTLKPSIMPMVIAPREKEKATLIAFVGSVEVVLEAVRSLQ